MKILYITNHQSIATCNGGFISDYMNDLLFYGLYETLGNQIVDSTPIVHMYKDNESYIDKATLWGGFSSFWLIDNDEVDRSEIREKIADRYFDIIVYGAIKRCQDFYSLVAKVYPAKRVIIVDGSDEQDISEQFLIHPYFKRELNQRIRGVLPISFAIPTVKLMNDKATPLKTQAFATVFPGVDDTYIFNDEAVFYEDYRKSLFGLTMKKDGWDCMRHYEILANRCMPYFIGLADCPPLTMIEFPKELILSCMNLFNSGSFAIQDYNAMLTEAFEYTQDRLTTKQLGESFLSKVI